MSMSYEPDPVLDPLFHAEKQKQQTLSKREQRERDELVLAARNLLASEPGKRFLCWLINETGVFAQGFTGNSTTFFLEGKRAVGLGVYRLLMTASPLALQELITFQRELNTKETSHE